MELVKVYRIYSSPLIGYEPMKFLIDFSCKLNSLSIVHSSSCLEHSVSRTHRNISAIFLSVVCLGAAVVKYWQTKFVSPLRRGRILWAMLYDINLSASVLLFLFLTIIAYSWGCSLCIPLPYHFTLQLCLVHSFLLLYLRCLELRLKIPAMSVIKYCCRPQVF